MNELIREYLDLVKRTMKTNDIFAYQKLEQMEHDYPEIADLVYQSAGSMSYDFQQSLGNRVPFVLASDKRRCR